MLQATDFGEFTCNGTTCSIDDGITLTTGTYTYASSTALTVSGTSYLSTLLGTINAGEATSFELPNSASCSVTATGMVCVDTTSGQLRYHDGTAERAITATTTGMFNIASTTQSWNGRTYNAASSTYYIGSIPFPFTLTGFTCKATTTNTVSVRVGDGTNWTNGDYTCDSTTVVTLTSTNNTFTLFEDMYVEASSTSATAPPQFTITLFGYKTND
jgi:hypothetical protein